jgi:AraC-like DNA-binding protein
MARKSHTNTAKPCQITPKLPFAVEPYLLTPAQERAVVALLEARSIAAAARQAGIPERTLHRWLRHDTDFQDELRYLRQQALGHAAARLQQGASTAADRLFTLLDSKDPIELAQENEENVTASISCTGLQINDLGRKGDAAL